LDSDLLWALKVVKSGETCLALACMEFPGSFRLGFSATLKEVVGLVLLRIRSWIHVCDSRPHSEFYYQETMRDTSNGSNPVGFNRRFSLVFVGTVATVDKFKIQYNTTVPIILRS
jgi:hypothetical protein